MANDPLTVSPLYTAITNLDREVFMLAQRATGIVRTEPDERIMAGEAMVMLLQDRKAMVQEIIALSETNKGA